jgi:phosphoribosylanthranilate isomerase
MGRVKDVGIKVCGMRDSANIRKVSELNPDYMGFIFYPKSKRYVGDNFVVPEIPNAIIKVGVFVNESTEVISRLAKKFSIDHVQLHGDETPLQCDELKALGFTVIKAFGVSEDFDFDVLGLYKSVCNYFLFDTHGQNYGGTGVSFDWDVLQKYDQEVPFFLSGGLSLANAENALKINGMNIHALDVNSNFEIEPAVKEVAKLDKLFKLRIDNYELRSKE